jgi:murein DD-endopeptidase MepM/ murein hydrolase activator NlpD
MKTTLKGRGAGAALAAFVGFLAGAFMLAVLVWHFGNFIGSRADRARLGFERPAAVDRFTAGVMLDDAGPAVLEPRLDAVASTTGERAAEPERAPAAAGRSADAARATEEAPLPTSEPRIGANPIEELRDRRLGLPVEGLDRSALVRSYEDVRSGGRQHQAIDILAPRNTPVLAVENGVVARLFNSRQGGLTIYQYDPSRRFIYYYAHLERYASGLDEGDAVRRGQVIGYVGTSGNAPPNTPHLHFAIFRGVHPDRWWEGTPIDPYDVLR